MRNNLFVIFTTLLLNVNSVFGSSVFIDQYLLLEYQNVLTSKSSFYLKSSINEFNVEFLIDKSESISEVDKDSLISLDSLIVTFNQHLTNSLKINVFVKDSLGYKMYSCHFFEILKFTGNQIYRFESSEWILEADFSIRISKDIDCGNGLQLDQDKLLLAGITKEYGKEIYEFKKCVSSSLHHYLVWYIQGFGFIRYEYPTEGIKYKLVKINHQSLEDYFKSHK